MTDAQIDSIQNGNKGKTAEWEAELLGLNEVPDPVAIPFKNTVAETSFVTLASDTDRFRARIRKLQDGRINPILEAGGSISEPQTMTSSPEPQEQQHAINEAASTISDAASVVVDPESGTLEVDTMAAQSHEPTPETSLNEVADVTAMSAIAIDANMNIQLETTTEYSNADDILKTDNLGENLVDNVVSEPNNDAIADPTTDPAIDLLVETVDETSASPTKANIFHLEPPQKIGQRESVKQDPPVKGKAKSDACAKAQGSKRKVDEEEATRHGPLIALILKTRSTVNNKVCGAPNKLKPSDTWKIAHSITEVSTPRRAWMLYEGTKRRRRALMHDKQLERAMSTEKDWFKDNLRKVTLDAKDWREEQERKDRKKEDKDQGVWVWDREEPVKRGEYVSRY